MNRIGIASAVMGLTAGICGYALGMGTPQGVNPDKPMLDGKTFTGTVTSQEDGTTHAESLSFENGMIRSKACEAMGFKPGPYIAIRKDGKTTVKGSVKNDKGEVNEIEAAVEDNRCTGTLTMKNADGTVVDTMMLKATKAGKMKESEPPAKTEHPTATEHPQ